MYTVTAIKVCGLLKKLCFDGDRQTALKEMAASIFVRMVK
jgi:hypothetical protein